MATKDYTLFDGPSNEPAPTTNIENDLQRASALLDSRLTVWNYHRDYRSALLRTPAGRVQMAAAMDGLQEAADNVKAVIRFASK